MIQPKSDQVALRRDIDSHIPLLYIIFVLIEVAGRHGGVSSRFEILFKSGDVFRKLYTDDEGVENGPDGLTSEKSTAEIGFRIGVFILERL